MTKEEQGAGSRQKPGRWRAVTGRERVAGIALVPLPSGHALRKCRVAGHGWAHIQFDW